MLIDPYHGVDEASAVLPWCGPSVCLFVCHTLTLVHSVKAFNRNEMPFWQIGRNISVVSSNLIEGPHRQRKFEICSENSLWDSATPLQYYYFTKFSTNTHKVYLYVLVTYRRPAYYKIYDKLYGRNRVAVDVVGVVKLSPTEPKVTS